MWANYSLRYIKSNKTSSIFLATMSFIATTFLTMLCSLAYNMWMDHVNQIIALEGSYTKRPEPLVAAYAFVIIASCISLIIMIHNAFEVPMSSRIHQLGILQSVGATPKQIRSFLVEEMMILCVGPLFMGLITGTFISYALVETVISLTGGADYYEVAFYFNFMIIVLSFMASGITILISAWIPAKKVSKITPLAAIGYGVDNQVPKMHRFRLMTRLFGAYGELARKSIYARRKELRTSTLSLTFAFIALIGLLNIEAISQISTKYTYFERFRNKWDMMLVTKSYEDTLNNRINELSLVEECIEYRKFDTRVNISEERFSNELRNLGITNLNNTFTPDANNQYAFECPVYVLDDISFARYCEENTVRSDGIVLINTIWNSMDSSRKFREYVPIVDESETLQMTLNGNEIVISNYLTNMPQIKEEYRQYSVSLIMSQGYCKSLKDITISDETNYNIFLIDETQYETAGKDIEEVLKEQYLMTRLDANQKQEDAGSVYTLESRPEEEIQEIKMRDGLKIFVVGFAGILACIGIVNIFSSTLGQIYQRKKEFVRYFSLGLSPIGMSKILLLEAIIICMRPFIISILFNVPVLSWALNAADISTSEYLQYSPIPIVGLFTLFVFAFILLAYYIGGRKIIDGELIETIKDETMI